LQVASTERQIQTARAEIDKLIRDQVAIQHNIAEAMSPVEMQDRLVQKGFRHQTPVYLQVQQYATEKESGEAQGVASIAPTVSESDLPASAVQSMFESVVSSFDTLSQKGSTP
jgi:hypothetical protein